MKEILLNVDTFGNGMNYVIQETSATAEPTNSMSGLRKSSFSK